MRFHNRPRRGVSIIYVCVAMLVLVGFCSLAVDLGRVQVAKTELERAIDAAGRAAAMATPSGVSAVQTAAYNMANANTVDGQAVTIDSINNVTFLNWPSTTPLTGSARSTANAVQVTGNYQVPLLFAQALGMPTATIHATSTSLYSPVVTNYQILGLNSVTYTANCYSDSYDSSLGSYASQTPGIQGSIASNGTIKCYSGTTVHGNVYYSGATVPTIASVGGVCTGTVTPISSTITATTPTVPGGATAKTINITGAASNVTLTAGTYSCTGVTVDSGGTLTINAAAGPVNLYCTGTFNTNGGQITTTGNIPSNFHIYMTTSGIVQLNANTNNMFAVVDAPLSTVHLTSSTYFFGSIIAKDLTVDSGCCIHYDTALGTNGPTASGATGTISQVQ